MKLPLENQEMQKKEPVLEIGKGIFFFPNRLSFKGQNNESAAHKAVGRMQSEEKTIRAGNKDLGAVVPFTEASHLCLGCQGPDRDDKS